MGDVSGLRGRELANKPVGDWQGDRARSLIGTRLPTDCNERATRMLLHEEAFIEILVVRHIL